ncbi:DNA polymerase-3 subunit epsilon [Arcanobacterium wilhelmae]|uniref:DNA polymerase-3 subunit epsilon n=1 Tax=Arcanobacterium wilhelmae TaxID=1803177 RepID=A0ABT9NCI7_9ACTO|nr:exonuclease domain-containing protein [Arcanobacterium wilhelmae]MDP9801431.1 DNA polymerase-3 subunit epsilon [Arcanobacterium wilhelmae]WFN90766.1 exonuclease domain-containing protein [Arcanobacterium wilhelmae]
MWTNNPIIGFDTETTGVDPHTSRLVTASVVLVEDGRTTRNYWLADPGVEIPEQAQRVHGISTEKAREEGRPVRDVLDEIADILCNHMQQGFVVVAYNASYDLTLMEEELARHGLATMAERLGREVGPIVDPFMVDKSCDRYRKGKRRLENLAQHYGVAQDDAFHNAEADVLATLRVLGAICRKYPDIAQMDLAELEKLQVETYNDQRDFFDRLNREKGRPTPPRGWPVARAQ